MKTREKTWKLKNKGFTLIEMIVTVAIIAIFSGVVVTFIGTGSSVYRSTSSNSKVQMETQETFDKIEDLIIDANRSLYYAYGSGSEIGAQITNDIKEKGGDGTNSSENKTFIACNEYENSDGKTSLYIYDVLDWQKSDGKIYYSRRQYTAESSNAAGSDDEAGNDTENFSDESEENPVDSGNAGAGNVRNAQTLVERSVLASGILDFRADVSKVKSDKIVRFQLSTENGKKQIQTLHSVSLRNNVDLKKPDDAFAKADATNVGIRIINAPDSMNPGESVMLVYGLTGNGSIDPTTVTWTVIDNKDSGSFPSQDHTNGRLTINENGSGYITVQVSAVSTTGQTVTSAAVTIKINATATPSPDPTPAPKQLILKQNANLLGAGQSYTLSDVVTSEMTYDDGSVKTDGYTLTWTSQPNLITVNGNTLTVSADAGKDATTGSIKLTATDSETKLYASIDITIARIDINSPKGEYKVGDTKVWDCVYKEGGNTVESVIPTKNVTQNSQTVSTYFDANRQVQGTFAESDVGSWEITASVDITLYGGLGVISDNCYFTVVRAKVQIVPSGNAYAIVRGSGHEYTCGYEGRNINLVVNGKTPGYNTYTDWSIEGNPQGVSIEQTDITSAKIIADNDAESFILVAKFKQRIDWTDEIEYEETAKFFVSVATGMKITGLPPKLKVGQTYDLKVSVTMNNIKQNSNGAYERYNTQVETQIGEDTAIYWKGAAVNDQAVKSVENGSKLIVEYKPEKKENDLIASMNHMKEIIYYIEGITLERDFTATYPIEIEE